MLVGVWYDFCTRWWRARPGQYGEMIGLCTCFTGSCISMFTSSMLQAQQIETAGYAVVILHNLGRALCTLWSPVYLYLFPAQLYGFVFGSQS